MNEADDNHISITIGYYDKVCKDNIAITNSKTGSSQFDDLETAISCLNRYIN